MFPVLGTGQQQQDRQSLTFSQSSATNDAIAQPAFGQYPPPSALGAFPDPFRSSPNPFPSVALGGSSFASPDTGQQQIGFGIAPFSGSAGFFGFQNAAVPQPTSSSPVPSHQIADDPPKSVFADFLKPSAMKQPESRPFPQVCAFFQKGSCRNGVSCPYLHESNAPSADNAELPIKFTVSNVGAAEIRSKMATANNHDPRSKAICRYFLAGACLKGESCKFLHDTKGSGSGDRHAEYIASDSTAQVGPASQPAVSPEGLFSRKASPTHAASMVFNANSVHSAKLGELIAPVSPKDDSEIELVSEEALTARSRRFRGTSSLLPDAPTPLVSAADDLIDEEEPEFASGSACIVGTLMTMCSEEEIRKRDLEMDVHILESAQDDSAKLRSARRADPERMVKKYQRSAAGMGAAAPSEVRPPMILAKTADYLFSNVLDSTLVPPLDVYNFLRDRFRAIRKDFALQDQAETIAATVHEQIARYFILSHHELCEEKEDDFQKFQNLQQISHTITSLNHYYKDLRIKNGVATPSEAEFYSYQILLNMRDANKLNDRLMNLPVHIRSAPLICVARELSASFRVVNYARFFRVLKTRATYLQRCCVHGFLWGFRSRALKIIYNGMGPVQSTLPLQSLIDILAFDDLSEAVHFCEIHGVTVINNEMVKTASPIEEEVKAEWMRSRVLIGPPEPSRAAVIMGDHSISAATPALVENRAHAQQERLRIEREAQEKKKLDEEKRLRELAAKEEAFQSHLKTLDTLCSQFDCNFTRKKKRTTLRMWHDLTISLRTRRFEERRRTQLQMAQRKFSEQKIYLTTLSKVARLFLTHVWLSRWRSRSWIRRRANTIAFLFRKHVWFRRWNRESFRVRQFKRLVRSRPAVSDILPVRQAITLPVPQPSPSVIDLLADRINNNSSRPRSDLRIRLAISVPALRYSDAVQNRSYSDFQVCSAVLRMLSVDRHPVSDSKVSAIYVIWCSQFALQCILRGGFSLDLRIIRTTGSIPDRPVQGVFFLMSNQGSFQFSSHSELLRFRALMELEPNTHVVALYPGDFPDPAFETAFRSRLPSFLGERAVVVNVPPSEQNLATCLAENLEWCIYNRIYSTSSSNVMLDSVIRLRCKEVVSVGVQPKSIISLFNQALYDISRSIFIEVPDEQGKDRVNEAKAIIDGHALPHISHLGGSSSSVRDDFAQLAGYVREALPGLIASEPVVSRMLQAISEGADTVGLVSVVVNKRADSLLMKLSARGLDSLVCCDVPSLSVDKHKSLLVPAIPKHGTASGSVDRHASRSPTQAKKRSRDTNSGPSIRDWKRKLLGQDGPSFSTKIDELLAQISR